MGMAAALVVAFALCAGPGGAQEQSQPGLWRGRLQVFQFNFMYGVGVQDRSLVTRDVEVRRSDYDLYQSAAGVAREELAHIDWNRSVEGPMDIRLFDYARGYGLVFDKGGSQAVRGPLVPPAAGKPLEQRRILGFVCDGTEYEWTTFQHARVELEQWYARDSDLRVPLLQVEYFTDDTGALLTLRVTAVSQLERASGLPASLFQAPAGLHAIDVPWIQ